MTNTLLISGSTGTLGTVLLPKLISHYDRIYLLVRAEHVEAHKKLMKKNLNEHDFKELIWFDADLTKEKLGLTHEQIIELENSVTAILHAAADTSFVQSLEHARQINVEGTCKMLKLAKSFKRLNKFGYVSTVYVSGKRPGLIVESDLLDNGFVNTYEQSKYEAEQQVHTFEKYFPIAIYRLSSIIGDETSGKIYGLSAIHQTLRLLHKGLLPFIPADSSLFGEVIGTQYASEVITFLFAKNFKPKTYHIVSGQEYSFTLDELISKTHQFFLKNDEAWRKSKVELPPFVDEETYTLFVDSAKKTQNQLWLSISTMICSFVPHLFFSTTYDNTNTIEDTYGTIKPKHISQYYTNIFEYCLRTNWGKTDE